MTEPFTHISTEPVDLSIVTISWNVADLLAACLESIARSPIHLIDYHVSDGIDKLKVEVIIVDSASTDDSVQMLREKFPWVHLITCDENIGFVRGNNLGAKYARGKYLMLLNPDTEIIDDVLIRLVEVLELDEKIGVVGPHTLNSDGTHQSTRRRFPTLLTGIFESTWLEPIAPRRILNDYRVLDKSDDATYPVGWLQGSALMTYRHIWESVGGLDERYIMYSEEMDWCKRVYDAGWQLVYVGNARIIHHSGQSTAQVKARSHVHFQHSKLRYFRKFHGRWVALILQSVLVLNYLCQIFVECAKWIVGHKRPLRAERIASYWIVLRSLLGAGEKIVIKPK
jgi:hypothetical protein